MALVLHSHMPYVEGFDTWPFGEEWLWEAVAAVYLPLLDVLDGAPVTLGLTPVLCDQLEAMPSGAGERCLRFLREMRRTVHDLDSAGLEESGEPRLAAEIRRAGADYERAADDLERRSLDPLAAFAALERVELWTSAATHALLPLMATTAGLGMQLATGIASHTRRFGSWGGGLWLPECAHAEWLDDLLEEAGARLTCVDWTSLLGPGAHAPRRTEAGVVLVPIDREAVDLVWAPDGYPSAAVYRDSHRLTARSHRPWANDGGPYDPDAAAEQVAADAAAFVDFVARREQRSVVALDTELLGHFWHEGVDWLGAVIGECERRGVALERLDPEDEGEAAPLDVVPTSWGAGRDLRTWSSPAAAGVAWRQRAAELRALTAHLRPSDRALRELLALQSSDWAFQIAEGTAGAYPQERVDGHLAALEEALADPSMDPAVRNLAPWI
jgi:1,4-alpha-glucan branching enzyme